MKVQVLEVSSYEREVEVELLPDEVRKGYDHVLNKHKKRFRVPGFRKGKVPRRVLLQRFGHQLEHEIVDYLVDESAAPALGRQGLVPVSQPILERQELGEGLPFRYTLRFEILPRVELSDYTGVEVEGVDSTVTSEAIEEALLLRQEKAVQLKAVDRAAAEGDVVRFSYSGSVDGETLPGGPRENLVATLGKQDILVPFEEALLGSAVGDVRPVDVELPEDHPNSEVAGKHLVAELTIAEVQERALPAIDDDFAMDNDFDDLAAMKVSIRDELQVELDKESRRTLQERVIKAVLTNNEFDIPPSLVHARVEANLQQAAQSFAQAGVDIRQIADPETLKADVRERVTLDVRTQVIVDALCRQERLEVTGADIDAKMVEIAKETNRPLPKVKATYGQGEGRAHLEQTLRTEQALDFLVSGATIVAGSNEQQEDAQ